MTLERIIELQKDYGVTGTQKGINTGEIWKFEGSVGRFAMEMIEGGVCFLPEERTQDYYGNVIPSRNDLQPGTKGTLENAENFWQKVEDGDFEAIEYLEGTFAPENNVIDFPEEE